MVYSGSSQTMDRAQHPASAGVVPKKEPREERLRIPRKNFAGQRQAGKPSATSRLPAGTGDGSSGGSASPRVFKLQASAGAADSRGTGRSGQDHSSYDVGSQQHQLRTSTVGEHSECDQSSPQRHSPSHSAGARPETTAAFDFGLTTSKPKVPSTLQLVEDSRSQSTICTPRKDKALPMVPSPHTPTFSLFPTPTTRPSIHPTSRPIGLHKTSSCVSPRVPVPLGISVDPMRPRKASLPSSLRSRADSCMSPRLLPSATIVTGSPNSALTKKLPRRPLPIRVSSNMPTSPPSTRSPSSIRWSGDTVARSSDSMDGRERSSTSSAPSPSPWPESGSFFEIDDDEEVPLRRKVATKIRSARAWSSSTVDSDVTIVARARRERTFVQKWLLCCLSR